MVSEYEKLGLRSDYSKALPLKTVRDQIEIRTGWDFWPVPLDVRDFIYLQEACNKDSVHLVENVRKSEAVRHLKVVQLGLRSTISKKTNQKF